MLLCRERARRTRLSLGSRLRLRLQVTAYEGCQATRRPPGRAHTVTITVTVTRFPKPRRVTAVNLRMHKLVPLSFPGTVSFLYSYVHDVRRSRSATAERIANGSSIRRTWMLAAGSPCRNRARGDAEGGQGHSHATAAGTCSASSTSARPRPNQVLPAPSSPERPPPDPPPAVWAQPRC